MTYPWANGVSFKLAKTSDVGLGIATREGDHAVVVVRVDHIQRGCRAAGWDFTSPIKSR